MNLKIPSLFFLLIFGFFGACFVGILRVYSPLAWYQALFISMNIIGVISMGLDKSFSRSASLRVPETVLYILATLGGSAGILLGCHIFKHKTKKASFQFVLLLITCAHLYVLRAMGFSLAG